MAADAFGNALGNSVVGQIEETSGETQQQATQQNADQANAEQSVTPLTASDFASPDLSAAIDAGANFPIYIENGSSISDADLATISFGNGSVFTGQSTQVADSGQLYSDASYDSGSARPDLAGTDFTDADGNDFFYDASPEAGKAVARNLGTAQHVLVNAESTASALFSQKALLVAISRQRDTLTVFTDSTERLTASVERPAATRPFVWKV